MWEVRSLNSLIIPGFQPIVCKTRANMRGGGVGFYVRDGLTFKLLDNLSPFEPKILESITIQLSYPGKSVLLSSVLDPTEPFLMLLLRNK